MNIDSNYLDIWLGAEKKQPSKKYPYRLQKVLQEITASGDYRDQKEQLEVLIKQLPDDHKFVGMIRKDFGERNMTSGKPR